MTTAIATTTSQSNASIMERVIIAGDLAALSPQERVRYYMETCQSLGLNPLTRPFDYIELNKKLTLYPTRTTTDQLREQKHISVRVVDRKLDLEAGIYSVEVEAETPDGRKDFATGVVPVVEEEGEWKSGQSGKSYFARNGQYRPMKGADLANAMMKAETKAKRRVTLSIVGLGWTDESELETIASARPVRVDIETGVIEGEPLQQPAPGEGQREYARLYSKLIDLGVTPEKDGKALPPSLPAKATAAQLSNAVDFLRGLVVQAETMTEAA